MPFVASIDPYTTPITGIDTAISLEVVASYFLAPAGRAIFVLDLHPAVAAYCVILQVAYIDDNMDPPSKRRRLAPKVSDAPAQSAVPSTSPPQPQPQAQAQVQAQGQPSAQSFPQDQVSSLVIPLPFPC